MYEYIFIYRLNGVNYKFSMFSKNEQKCIILGKEEVKLMKGKVISYYLAE